MPVYDYNGTTNSEIKKIYDNNGTTSYEIGKAYDNNGTTSSEVFASAVTVTDLINFKGWSAITLSQHPNLNSQDEMLMPSSSAFSSGVLLYTKAPGIGYINNARISQNISLTNGHKYYIAMGTAGYGGCQMSVTFLSFSGTYSGQYDTYSVCDRSAIYTASSTTSYSVIIEPITSEDNYAYGRMWYATAVDLTAAFGSGSEPNVSWCDTYIGRSFGGTKEIEV